MDSPSNIIQHWFDSKLVSQHLFNLLQQKVTENDSKFLECFAECEDNEIDTVVLSECKKYIIDVLNKEWDYLFQDCTTGLGKKLSKHERAALKIVKDSLVYGEVTFSSLGDVFFSSNLDLKPGGVFYDLGSGTGRGVFAAVYLHDFQKVWGIEILEGLTNASLEVCDRFEKHFRPRQKILQTSEQKIGFTRCSFLDVDWSDGDVVFANSTCFEESLMEQIRKQVIKMREGSYFITLTKRLNSPYFRLVDSTQHVMSWGYATVHVQQRLPHDMLPLQEEGQE